MRLAAPVVDEHSYSGALVELGSQQGHDGEKPEQAGCGAGHGTIRPLPLRLHPQMGAGLLERDRKRCSQATALRSGAVA
jgi:hypothetical protein